MISRRELLSWLGASAGISAVATGNPLTATSSTPSAKNLSVVNLETFRISHADRGTRVYAYLADAVLPHMEKIHTGPRLCLDAIVAPYTPQAAVLAVYASFDEMLDIRAALAANPRIRQVRAELEAARILGEVHSQVLVASPESLHFPVDANSLKTSVLEMRSYDAPAWHDGAPASLNGILRRAGIQPIVNAASAAGEHVPRLTYVIPFENLAAREQAWSRVDADPEWIAMQRDSAGMSPITVTGKSIYKLAPDSLLG